MDKPGAEAELKIGLFGIGLDAYWPQFRGLQDRLKGSAQQVGHRLERAGAQVVNLGLIDTPEKAVVAGHDFSRADVDLIFLFGRLEPISILSGIPAPDSDVSALGLTGVFQNLPSYARMYPGIGFQGINALGWKMHFPRILVSLAVLATKRVQGKPIRSINCFLFITHSTTPPPPRTPTLEFSF
jgi:hypothetical protein